MRADVLLGYAIFDAENTTRLGEQSAEVQAQYFARGNDIMQALKLRPKSERVALANKILEIE